MSTLGKRIKFLRKKKNATLEHVCGNQMSVSMLSLIENDKAQPSVEKLAYIAERLGVNIEELLVDVSMVEVRELYREAKPLLESQQYRKVIRLCEEFIKGDLPVAFESAKLYEIYAISKCKIGDDAWEDDIKRAHDLYSSLNFYGECAKMDLYVIAHLTYEQHYERAYDYLIERTNLYSTLSMTMDKMDDLEFLYYRLVLLFAKGCYEEALTVLDEAIEFSKRYSLYYRLEELYRVACFCAMFEGEAERVQFFIKKLFQLGRLMDSKEALASLFLVKAHYYNEYLQQYSNAHHAIERFRKMIDQEGKRYYFMEKGKAYFGEGHYEEALLHLQQVGELRNEQHPLNLSIIYAIDAYIARCHYYLGNKKAAIHHAKKAWEKIKGQTVQITHYKDFIYETFVIMMDDE